MSGRREKSPALARKLLSCILWQQKQEGVAGDFEEIYSDITKRNGVYRASLWYWGQLFLSAPGFVYLTVYWSFVMVKSYIKLAIRNLIRNKLSSFINLFGLSTAIACSVIAFAIVHYAYNQDGFHENADSIFMVENVISVDGRKNAWSLSPVPLGPALESEFPGVKHAVRIDGKGGTMRYDDKVFQEIIGFADVAFFEMFTFPLKRENKNVLDERSAVVLSSKIAEKYFGDEDPIGKQVTITLDGSSGTFFVRGVTKPFPQTATFFFDILLPYESKGDFGFERFTDWGAFTRATFIQLQEDAVIETIEDGSVKYIATQNAAREDWQIERFIFEPLADVTINAYAVNGSVFNGAHPAGIVTIAVIGIFLLSLACFNYMNISIAAATRRLKEIGVRKVVGSSKSQLVRQFLSENMVLCFLALVIGVLLTKWFFLPGFNLIVSAHGVQIPLNLQNEPAIWLFLAALLLITGVGAGAYPAFYISAFQPVKIFRDRFSIGGSNFFTKVLLILQFTFSFITVFFGIAFAHNAQFQKGRDWGYKHSQVIVVPITGHQDYTVLRNEVIQDANIVALAGSQSHIGRISNSGLVKIGERKYDVRRFGVGYGYIETMGLRLKEGRSFEQRIATDAKDVIIVNESFVKNAGLLTPVGTVIKYEEADFRIIGVLQDYHYRDFQSKIQPVLLQVTGPENFRFLSFRVQAGNVVQTSQRLAATWKKLFPDQPYLGFFQDSVFAGFYQQNAARTTLSLWIAAIALVLTCMGLFGLTALNIAKRMKELSIRKVLGANLFEVSKILNRDFLVLMSAAFVFAAPVSYFLMDKLLDYHYVYRIELNSWLLVLTASCLLLTAVVTISSQLYKVLQQNSVHALRTE